MRKPILLSLATLCATLVFAQSPYDKYYTNLPVEIEHVQPVVIPDYTVSLTDFGGVNDGTTLNTDAFKDAIKALSKAGGGHLLVPDGTWLTGPIVLKSNIDLHLADHATILFSKDRSLYVLPNSKGEIPSKANPCVKVSKCENVSITGHGTLEGQGIYWRYVKHQKVDEATWNQLLEMGGRVVPSPDGKAGKEFWYPFGLKKELGVPDIAKTAEEQEAMRYHLVHITDSKNILVEGVHIQNSPKFHLVPTRCQNLIIDGVTIRCPEWAQNGDAMDIGNTQVCLVVNCNIACGDDGICMKGGVADKGVAAGPNRDFLIQKDTVYHAHGGFVIGSEFSGGMQRMVVRNCLFDGAGCGLRFKSAPGRGGWCEDIFCYDIIMKNIGKEGAIAFTAGYADKAGAHSATATDNKETYFPNWSNITIKDVTAVMVKGPAVSMQGLKASKKQPDAKPVHDIVFENVQIIGAKEGLNFENAENITFKGCNIKGQNTMKSCKKILFDGKDISSGDEE